MGRLLSTLVLLVAAVAFVGCDTDLPTDTDAGTLYTQQEIDYFLEIALGAEFGGNTPHIRRWTNDVKINVQGDPTDADFATLQQVIDELNFDNAVTLLQQGQGNTTLAKQLGSGDVIDVMLIGEANRLDVRQVGQDNLYVLAFEGDGLTHSVLQQGQGIEQIGIGGQSVSIAQRGSGMRVMIEHNPAR